MMQEAVSERELVEIACKASSLTERLNAEFVLSAGRDDDQTAEARVQRWCQMVAGGDWEKFERRLALDDLDLQTVRRALASVQLSDEQKLPAWIDTLSEVTGTAARLNLQALQDGDGCEHRYIDPQEPIPFESVHVPFVQVARRKLIARSGSSYMLLSGDAHAAFERNLLKRLSYLSSRTLFLEFSILRKRNQPLSALFTEHPQDDASRILYREFIGYLLGGGLLTFFHEYAVLARLVATATDLWVDAVGELLYRLESDRVEIQETFQVNGELGQVVTVQPTLSDRHNGGRTVIALTFASGLELIYKPKDLGMERAYFNLLEWFNENGAPLPFKVLKVIDRSAYGWVEFVKRCPCDNGQEASRYFQRAGMLLCMVHVLGGIDCQRENIIAYGEHPVLVDTEALISPGIKWAEDQWDTEGVQYLAGKQFWDSVLSTHLLPRWELGPNGQSYDASGLAGMSGQETPFRRRKWKNINTDRMALEYEHIKTSEQSNIPTLHGTNLSINDYAKEVIDGFRQMYNFFVEHREVLLAPGGPLQKFIHRRSRFIFRSTVIYFVLLQKMLDPKFLRDGAERSIHLDILSGALLSLFSKNPFWPLMKEEQRALEQMDIPFFTTCSDSDALTITPGQTVEGCFTGPGYNLVVSRLSQLSDEDAEKQVAIIRGSLLSRVVREAHHSSSGDGDIIFDSLAPLDQEEIVREAIAIAEGIQKHAIRAPDGGATWITIGYIPEAQRYQLQPMSYNLYDGSCGVALFLAALEKVTGGAGFRDLAMAALQPLRSDLQKFSFDQIAARIGCCKWTGCGLTIYALARISRLLDEPAIMEEAKHTASLLTREHIASDQDFDIISGAAGTILGWLALYEGTKDRDILAQAVACGEHLLNNRVASRSGHRAWRTLNGELLTGFSHGAAGIAHALLRLFQVTNESAFLEAALEANAYEADVFTPAEGNWPDLRSPITEAGATYRCAWCHGAPGIGLARVAALDVVDTAEIRRDIEVAIKTTVRHGLQGLDHLCCGNLGAVEFLFTAALKLSRPQLLQVAGRQAARIVTRARQNGSYGLTGKRESDAPGLLLGFYQGESGIGYELLRLAYPDMVPSVLLLE